MALLDQIDIKILQALQNNAKVNMKELSAELNISKTPVYERVKRLEEEGYIRNYVALVDNKKVGLPLVVFCNVSLAVHNDEHIQRFKAEIQEIDEVMECYSIGGIYDFFLKVVVKDLAAYDQFVFNKLNQSKWHRKDAEFLRVERDQAYDRPEGRARGSDIDNLLFLPRKEFE